MMVFIRSGGQMEKWGGTPEPPAIRALPNIVNDITSNFR